MNYAIKIYLIAESQFIFISDFEELGKNKNKMKRNIIYRQKSFLFQLIKLVHYVGESSFAQVLKNITYQTKIIFSPPSYVYICFSAYWSLMIQDITSKEEMIILVSA